MVLGKNTDAKVPDAIKDNSKRIKELADFIFLCCAIASSRLVGLALRQNDFGLSDDPIVVMVNFSSSASMTCFATAPLLSPRSFGKPNYKELRSSHLTSNGYALVPYFRKTKELFQLRRILWKLNMFWCNTVLTTFTLPFHVPRDHGKAVCYSFFFLSLALLITVHCPGESPVRGKATTVLKGNKRLAN